MEKPFQNLSKTSKAGAAFTAAHHMCVNGNPLLRRARMVILRTPEIVSITSKTVSPVVKNNEPTIFLNTQIWRLLSCFIGSLHSSTLGSFPNPPKFRVANFLKNGVAHGIAVTNNIKCTTHTIFKVSNPRF